MKQSNDKKILAAFIPVALGLAMLASGSLVSVAEEPPPSEQPPVNPIVEGAPSAQTPEEPSSGEVQERGVSPKTLQPGLELKLLTPLVPPNPPAFGTLPGEFAIRTALKKTYLTARDGGHHSIDAVITAATTPGPYEKFKLATVQPSYTTVQTARGYYLGVLGGRGAQYDPTQVVQTEVQTPQNDSVLLGIHSLYPGVDFYTIQPFGGGYFLTALGGGGKTTAAFHSDATRADTWEKFYFLKCGDLGTGYRYTIALKGYDDAIRFMLGADGGGGRVTNGIHLGASNVDWLRFGLIRQSDGSYALQTSNGRYVTAVGGGGLASGDNLHTDATQVQDWEKFRIVDQGDCSYTIQTVKNWYLGVTGTGAISTRISDPNAAPSIGYIAKFDLKMMR